MKRTVCVLVASCLVAPASAFAGEGESALSVSIGGATWWAKAAPVPPETKETTLGPTAGAALGIAYERGISEALSWRVAAAGAAFGVDGVSGGGWASGGLTYRVDVLKYVPYGVAGIGALIVGGGPLDEVEVDPALEVGAGLDVLTGRTRSWGIEAHVATFTGDLWIATLGVRGTARWGFF